MVVSAETWLTLPKISGVVRKLNAENRKRSALSKLDLVDVLRIDFGFHGQPVGVRHDHHDRFPGGNHAAHRVNCGLKNRAILRRANVRALELI